MKRKTPLSNFEILFYALNHNEPTDPDILSILDYDKRHDFSIDSNFAGIAVSVEVNNDNYYLSTSMGACCQVLITLVDATDRIELSSVTKKVTMTADDSSQIIYTAFCNIDDFKPNHSYRLVVRDASTLELIDEDVFHIFGENAYGRPATWYQPLSGCLRPDKSFTLYRNMNFCNREEGAFIRFHLRNRVKENAPLIMPELELRLFDHAGLPWDTKFASPERDKYEPDEFIVEFPYFPIDPRGVVYVELVCMEYPIAGFAFSVDKKDVATGEWGYSDLCPLDNCTEEGIMNRFVESNASYKPDNGETENLDALIDNFLKSEESNSDDDDNDTSSDDEDDDDLDDGGSLLSSLDNLTGLRSVKEKLTLYERVVRFNKMRMDKNLATSPIPLHAMFLGSPGTGKTTVAKLMGKMLRRAGVLSKGHVVVRERATLLGQNYHSESEKTMKAIEDAQGGILLIDEAYQLYQPNDPRDPGRFVIETLLTTLADESRRDWMLVLAGYPDEMKRLFDMNPGLKSRIPESNIYTFDDFSESELMEIAEKYLSRNDYTLTDEARSALARRLGADYSSRDKNFGNARHVVNMIQTEILPAMAVRVTDSEASDNDALTLIQPSDIPQPAVALQPLNRSRIGFALS